MKIGIIAGNRLLPILLAKNIKDKVSDAKIIAICFHGETSKRIKKYADHIYWVNIGQLKKIKDIMKEVGLREWIMAGQVNPLAIFNRKGWDADFSALMHQIKDIRPHTVFDQIIRYLEKEKVAFLDSTDYLKESLADDGLMNNLRLSDKLRDDIDFGLRIIDRFVELDVGQTIAVKAKSAIALESLEGTDRTIKRAFKLAGSGCTILKFSKADQDLRFDVPVVGLSTLKLLKKVKAASLVLETGKVLILEKEKFLSLATKWAIPIVGSSKVH